MIHFWLGAGLGGFLGFLVGNAWGLIRLVRPQDGDSFLSDYDDEFE